MTVGRESPMVERLAAADLMLVWPEAKGWPQDIGALGILDGGRLLDADGRVRIETAREHIGRRLHSFPLLSAPVLTERRSRVAAVGGRTIR